MKKAHKNMTDDDLVSYMASANGLIGGTLKGIRADGHTFANAAMRIRLRGLRVGRTLTGGGFVACKTSFRPFSNKIEGERPHVFTFDIETTPEINFTWGRFKQFIAPIQHIKSHELLSVQYKLLGDDTIYNLTRVDYSHEDIVRHTHDLFNMADIIVGQNSINFDIKMMNRFFIQLGLTPPSPYRCIDTMQMAKAVGRFPSNSMAVLGRDIGLRSQKLGTSGFGLWLRCMKNVVIDASQAVFSCVPEFQGKGIDKEAWAEMIEYGNFDVITTEELYLNLRPWHKTHPNFNVYRKADKPVCPSCGSENMKYQGFHYTNVSKFMAKVCGDCGARSRDRVNVLTKEKRKTVVTSI